MEPLPMFSRGNGKALLYWIVFALNISVAILQTHPFNTGSTIARDRIFLFQFFEYFANVTDQLSDKCVNAMNYIWRHQSDTWVIKMIDSNSVIESGLTDGNVQFLGSFDQCLALKLPSVTEGQQKVITKNNSSSIDQKERTIQSIQYCTVQFPINMIFGSNQTNVIPPFILQMVPPQAGICLPDACNSINDIPVILNEFSNVTGNTLQLTNCVREDDLMFKNRFKASHYCILCVYLVLLLLCMVATVQEVYTPNITKVSNWYTRVLYCFSFKRNFNYLFQTTIASQGSAKNNVQQNKPPYELSANREEISHQQVLIPNLTTVNKSVVGKSSTSSLNVPCETEQSSGEVSSISHSTTQLTEMANKSTLKLGRPQIECLHGIRVISFIFILIYHTFTEAQTPSMNLIQVLKAERNFIKQLITNAALWVDTFFLLSGFLVAHTAMYQSAKKQNNSSILSHLRQHPKRLLHRYLRLTPSVAGVLSLSILIEALGSGPIWNQYIELSFSTCHKNWWILFLYVNNIFKLNQLGQAPSECLSYLWYLAVDMQFFLISPLLVVFLTNISHRLQLIGVAINVVVIVISWIITAVLMSAHGLTPTVLVNVYDLRYINEVYKSSYCRIGPYCVGILLAYVLYKRNVSKQINSADTRSNRNVCCGLFMLLTALLVLFAVTMLTYPWLHDADYHNAQSILYGTTHRTIWAFAWALIIYACVDGILPLVNRFFGYALFQILSKLTYQSYLLHSILITAVVNSVRNKIYYSDANFVFYIFQYFILTTLVAICFFVTFERPFMNLEQTFIR